MKKYALIGYPLGHSLSPNIHTRLLELSGIKGGYEKLEISPEKLNESFDTLRGLDGFNITIPHKIAIIDYCDELSEGARRYKSVNCVKNGEKKIGYNTDVLGFTKSIDMLGASLSSKVLLIGCGGVGRMIAIETALKGGDLTIAVLPMDIKNAESVKSEISEAKPDAKINIVTIKGGNLTASDFGGNVPEFDLLINASPVGMYPKVENCPCGEEIIDKVRFLFDVIYNPKETLLSKTAKAKGKKAMTGMAMLVLQAAAAHEIWNGSSFKEEDLRKLISDMEELV